MINEVTLIGNVGIEPEVRIIRNGESKVANFTFATNEGYYDDKNEWVQVTQWHRVVAWNKLAERCEKFSKGQLLFIKGSISYRNYEDDKGVKHYVTEIAARTIRSLERKENSGGGNNYSQPRSGGTYQSPPPNSDLDDDLPF